MDRLRFAAIVQARTTSKRLPNKVLKKIGNMTILEHIIYRLKRVKRIDVIFLAVPHNDGRRLCPLAYRENIGCFLGDERDVLDRYYKANIVADADYIIRATGDNPFIDIESIELGIEYLLSSDKIDLFAFKGLPLGMAVEFISRNALTTAWKNGKEPYHREHVTTYIKEHPELFYIDYQEIFTSKEDRGIVKNIRLTIDEKEDLVVAREVFKRLGSYSIDFGVEDVLELYREAPEIFKKNISIKQKDMRSFEK